MSISNKTRKILWALSGGRCARDFVKLIERGKQTPAPFVVGEEAHIVAEENDGPRGDPLFPNHLRNEVDNLILLCPTCHEIVDKQPDDYSVAALHVMRAKHEAKIEDLISGASAADAERQAIAAYYQAFDRYAFRLAMYHEESISFFKAIRDTRIALTTGVVRLDEREVVSRVIGKSRFTDSATRNRLDRVADLLFEIENVCSEAFESGALDAAGISYNETFLVRMDYLRNETIREANEAFRKYGFEELPSIKAPMVRGLGNTTTHSSRWHLLDHAYEETPPRAPSISPPPQRRVPDTSRTVNRCFPGLADMNQFFAPSSGLSLKATPTLLAAPNPIELFFVNFDQFADAPDAVAKMRELVLQMAVQGKLVEQKQGDGKAKSIFSDRLPDNGECRYEIPATWMWIRFASVGEQRLGKMLDQRGNRGDLKPYLRNTNVQWMRFQLDDIKELRLAPEELEEFRLQPDDLLICEGGEPGRCAIWRDSHQEMYFQKAIHRVRPRKGILSEYLAICLQVDAQNGVLAKQFTGATIKHFTGRSLREYSIALPPLAEQKRIVAKADELMALCDRLEAQQQERDEQASALARASLARFAEAPTPANLNLLFHNSYSITPADLRKVILTMAVQGKLLPQDPKDEPVQRTFRGLKPFDSGISGTIEAPSQWEVCDYRSLTSLVTSGSRGWKEYYADAGAIFIRTQNIKTDSLVLDDVAFVQLPKTAEGMRSQVLKNDIMITITGANVTKAARVIEEIPEAYISQHIALTRPRWSEMSQWLHLCFVSHGSARGMLEQLAYGDKPGLNLNNIRDLILPIPPLAEQRRIVAKVDQLMALVDQLETQLADSRSTAKNLLQAIVAKLTN